MRQGAAHARAIGPTREVSDPRTCGSALGAVSHAIRLGELSTVSTNVAIPTIWLRGAARCRGELHATFAESSPGGTHALPLIAPPVAQPLTPPVAPPVAQPVAPPVAQPLARQWRASGLTRWIPSPQTTGPSPTQTDQRTTHRLAMKQPPPTPTFPHQQADKPPHNQHALSILHVGSHHLQY